MSRAAPRLPALWQFPRRRPHWPQKATRHAASAPRRTRKGPLVFMNYDQIELDAAYTQRDLCAAR